MTRWTWPFESRAVTACVEYRSPNVTVGGEPVLNSEDGFSTTEGNDSSLGGIFLN